MKRDQIAVGQERGPLRRLVTQEKINAYAEASGDFNPIHVDPEFARKTPYGGTIAHGFLTVAYLSEMMTQCFGKGWISGGRMEVAFRAPVKPGSTVTVRGTVVEIAQEGDRARAECEVWCEVDDGTRVLTGRASALLE